MQTACPRQYNFNNIERVAICTEIDKLLQKQVIKVVDHTKGEYISNIFVRPKKDGAFRMILNLEQVNECITYHKFKMSTLKSAVNLITPDCFMATIDWKDAYYSVKIHKEDKKLLRFMFDGTLYEFQALPNGLASGPRVFTKITKPLFAQLRRRGFLNSPYIDDCLLIGDSIENCRENVRQTIALSCKTGFVVHPDKSKFRPTQEIEFLGFTINSVDMKVRVNPRQTEKIVSACNSLMAISDTTIRHLAQVVGLLVASFPGVEAGPLYYRRLDNAKNMAIKSARGDFNQTVRITDELKLDLKWWLDNIHDASKPIDRGNHTLTINSDASLTGWGAACNGKSTGGRWTAEEGRSHINLLELKAAWFALRCFANDISNTHIKLLIDNTTALAYIGNMGGRIDSLNDLTRTIWQWCLRKKIWLTVAYIKSEENVEADLESRRARDNIEWELNKSLFKQICDKFGNPEVDLFASRLNTQLNNYVSWKQDPFALDIDAFTLNWQSIKGYIFPPFTLIHRILHKIQNDNMEFAIVVVPFWTTQTWFPKLGRLLTDVPFLLPREQSTLQHPLKEEGHELQRMQLMACRLSGRSYNTDRFLREQPKLCWAPGESPLSDSIQHTLRDGWTFVVKDRLITCHPL